MNDVLIVGGGIGGLTLALELHAKGIPCRVFESAPEIKAVGVGINLLPHAMRACSASSACSRRSPKVAVETQEAAFFNRFGQLIYREPLGRRAGYEWPQFSIHRGDLQLVLLDAVKARIGADRLHLGWHCTGFEQDESRCHAAVPGRPPVEGRARHRLRRHPFRDPQAALSGRRRAALLRRQHVARRDALEAGPVRARRMMRAGWLADRQAGALPDPQQHRRGGPPAGELAVGDRDAGATSAGTGTAPAQRRGLHRRRADWHFDWLDVPAFFRAAELVLEYPMVDKDPLPAWTFGRVTLLGDAAHPM